MMLNYSNILLTIVLLFLNQNIFFAQRFNHEVSKEKTNNRFIASIDISEKTFQIGQPVGCLVKSIKLGIECWELMNEPIERYMFKWERNSSVYSSKHVIYLDEHKLAKYPDLLKRFQNLKPSFVSIKFDVSFSYNDKYSLDNQNLLKTLPTCVSKSSYAQISGKTFYNPSFTVTRSINSRGHFFIDKHGIIGNDLTPVSPKTWKDFLPFDRCYDDISSEQVKNIYKSVNIANFSNLRIDKIEYPIVEIDAIAAEYKKREKKDDFWDGEKDKKEPKKNNPDDFWEGGKDKKQLSNNTDFWDGKGSSEEEKKLNENTKPDESDQFIGNVRSRTSRVRIFCVDTGQEDGDLVRISNNGTVLKDNIYLRNSGNSYWFDLQQGQNNLEIFAINQGSSGANTAAFKVYDDKGNLLAEKNWHLKTGYKGKLLILKL